MITMVGISQRKQQPAKIIKGMMDEGIVVKDDPKLLAAELTAPAVLQIARSDRQPQCEKGRTSEYRI